MMKVIPYNPSHEEVYIAFIMKTEIEPKTEVFSAKPTGTVRQKKFSNRNNTMGLWIWEPVNSSHSQPVTS